jgi:dTDP-4-dehydrorhamnose 3,5-epimerase
LIFTETPLPGAFILDAEPIADERGYFARVWCRREFEAHRLVPPLAQSSISFNTRRGTLRGLHFQAAPHGEVKLVRCISGAVFDVIVDLRSGSPTCANHYSIILSAENKRSLYIPQGFAHGFQTLEDNTEVMYHMSEFYHADFARGVRWDDPAFGIEWPSVETRTINARDRDYADFCG